MSEQNPSSVVTPAAASEAVELPKVQVETTGLENVATVASPVRRKKISERSEKSDDTELLYSNEISDHEKNVEERIIIHDAWIKISKLLKAESLNTWALGDEFITLYTHRVTYQDIAKRVSRSLSFVQSLCETAKVFPPNMRHLTYSWFQHEILRRAYIKATAKIRELKIELTKLPKGQTVGDAYLAAIKDEKARTPQEVVPLVYKVMAKFGMITEEQRKLLQTEPPKFEVPFSVSFSNKGDLILNMKIKVNQRANQNHIDALKALIAKAQKQLESIEATYSPPIQPIKANEDTSNIEDMIPDTTKDVK